MAPGRPNGPHAGGWALVGPRGSIRAVCDGIGLEAALRASGVVSVSEQGDEQVESVLHIARAHSDG